MRFTTCTYVQTRGHAHTSIHRKVLRSEAWHPSVDYELTLAIMTNFSMKSGAARAAPAAPLLTALYMYVAEEV